MRSFSSFFDIFWALFFLRNDFCPFPGFSGSYPAYPGDDQPVTRSRTQKFRTFLTEFPYLGYHSRYKSVSFLPTTREISEIFLTNWIFSKIFVWTIMKVYRKTYFAGTSIDMTFVLSWRPFESVHETISHLNFFYSYIDIRTYEIKFRIKYITSWRKKYLWSCVGQ